MVIILLLFCFLIGINLIQLKFAQPGSDHFVHFGYINSIKKKRHRFITRVSTFINDEDFPDPQLYHWILALIPSRILKGNYQYLGLVFNVLSFGFFIFFLDRLYPFLDTGIDYNWYLLICGVIYILTPFEYFVWNAKNVGLSARGFGLMLGHLFIYALILYVLSGEYQYLIFSIIIAYLILLSSQFAFQFVTFFCLVFPFFTGDYLFITIPFVAVVIFLVTLPKWSVIFFKRQWEYKKMYCNVLSWRFGLKWRYSIWRDFVYDFWVIFKNRDFIRSLEYIYRNPVIEILIGFPALTVSFLYAVVQPDFTLNNNVLLLKVIASALMLFLLTSFRYTRFLGEPQRYVEFVFPIIAVLPVVFPGWPLTLTIGLSILIISFEVVGIKFLAKRDGGGKTTHEKILEVLNYFKLLELRSENRIASNNADLLKFFSDKDYRILNINVTSPYTGGLHFNEIFPENYGNMALGPLLYLIKYFEVDWLVLDLKLIDKETFIKSAGSNFKEEATIYHFAIFKTC